MKLTIYLLLYSEIGEVVITAYRGIIEAAIYCWYRKLKKQLSTADSGIDEVATVSTSDSRIKK